MVDDKWSVYYSRGIAYERSNQWQDAENDLKQALKLKPNDPYVLNYLAYSWLDRNTNVNQALELLKRLSKLNRVMLISQIHLVGHIIFLGL